MHLVWSCPGHRAAPPPTKRGRSYVNVGDSCTIRQLQKRHRPTAEAHLSRTVAELGEAGLVALIDSQARRAGRAEGVTVGIGDDAAILARVRGGLVLTTDMLVEHVDFELTWARWADVGHKAAAANLSDLAGMGARPRGLLLSLGLRPSDPVSGVAALVRSLARVGARYGAPLVGGDLSGTSGPLVVSVTAVGEVAPRRALLRHKGRPGDLVAVTGRLGGAAAGLWALQHGSRVPRALVARQLRPSPRVELGLALARSGVVRSGADLSDGLGNDSAHVASDGCGVRLQASSLPLDVGVAALAHRAGVSPRAWALSGGEDFELVLAIAPAKLARAKAVARAHGVALTVVGELVRGRGVVVVGEASISARGFEHFRAAGRTSPASSASLSPTVLFDPA